jgi:hypothetical protein
MKETIFLKVAEYFYDLFKPFSIRTSGPATFTITSVELGKFRVQLKTKIEHLLQVKIPDGYKSFQDKSLLPDVSKLLKYHYGIPYFFQPDPLTYQWSEKGDLLNFLDNAELTQLFDIIEATLFTKLAYYISVKRSSSNTHSEVISTALDSLRKKDTDGIAELLRRYSLNYRIEKYHLTPLDPPVVASQREELIKVFKEKKWKNAELEFQKAFEFIFRDPAKAILEATKGLETIMMIILEDRYNSKPDEKKCRYNLLLESLKKKGFFKSLEKQSGEKVPVQMSESILGKVAEIMKNESPSNIRGPEEHGKGKKDHTTSSSHVAQLLVNIAVAYAWFLVKHDETL